MYISSFSHRRYFFSLFVFMIGVGCMFYSLTGKNLTASTEDTLWVIDNSLSMSVQDMKNPEKDIIESRLEIARSLVTRGIQETSGEQGVIIYAHSPAVLMPMTLNKDALVHAVDNITPVTDGGGSDISSSLMLIDTLYRSHNRPIHIILITDGGDTSTSSLPDFSSDMRVTLVGIGTESGGPIPLGYDALGKPRYKIYKGEELNVALEKNNIEKIQKKYDAHLLMMTDASNLYRIVSSIIPTYIPTTSPFLSEMFLYFGGICVVFALFYHPYVRQKHL